MFAMFEERTEIIKKTSGKTGIKMTEIKNSMVGINSGHTG